jgi:DNA-binding NarL/FixJ family response regulator
MPISAVIVEDDAVFRGLLASAVAAAADLLLLGTADDLASGRRLLEQHAPDVLLVDLGLPDGSGIDLIRHAASRLPACDVMVITAFGDERHVIEAIEAGATGYLHKDAADADLVAQIRALHAGGSPISPVIARRLLSRWANPAAPVAALPDDPAGGLSAQERKVLSMSAKGYTYEETAALLGVSRQTVQTYVKRIYRKLQVHTKTEAVFEARRIGWLPP